MRKNADGFSLVEAAIVLGVIGLVIGGIWIAAAAASEKLNVNRTVQAFQLLSQRLEVMYKSVSFSGGVTYDNIDSLVIKSAALPADFISGSHLVTPWGGVFTVDLDNYANLGWRMIVNVPVTGSGGMGKAACVRLINEMVNWLAPHNAQDQIQMNGIYVSSNFYAFAQDQCPTAPNIVFAHWLY